MTRTPPRLYVVVTDQQCVDTYTEMVQVNISSFFLNFFSAFFVSFMFDPTPPPEIGAFTDTYIEMVCGSISACIYCIFFSFWLFRFLYDFPYQGSFLYNFFFFVSLGLFSHISSLRGAVKET